MYITQTYLGFSSNSAKVYVYFLSESYMSNRQRDLHEVFLKRTAELGLSTGSEIAVLLPVNGCEMSVLGDMNDSLHSPLQEFYKNNVREQLPGLLVTRKPLDTKAGIQSAVFFSFNNAEHPFKAAKELIQKISEEPRGGPFVKFLEELNSFVILEPNFNGIGININRIVELLIEKLK
ncbi:hypothetical protein [Undibacterium sp. Di24W]|uniref:hypothetical protein n=1 Tax=Undibacterium sp. Di24W TaxID=3413033 RepID=UPI003BF0852A